MMPLPALPATRIFVERIQIYAHHGVHPEELKLGQKFVISVDCAVDPAHYAHDDHLRSTVSYARLTALVIEVSNQGPFKLLETFGEAIALAILGQCPSVQRTDVTIVKPGAPVGAVIEGAGVTITRQRRSEFALALGGNLGGSRTAKRAALLEGLQFLGHNPNISIAALSHFYETDPWGNKDQPSFVNAVALCTTSLAPEQLLDVLHACELCHGRTPREQWGARLLDLDVLFFGTKPLQTARLTLPHPHLFARAFVLIPLLDVLHHEHWLYGAADAALAALSEADRQGVRRILE